MSLAATLSASGMRPASFLPAIKCSDCGDEIEIARMGEHVCASQPKAAALTNPYAVQQWTAAPQQQSSQTSNARLPITTYASSPLQHAYVPESNVPSPVLRPGTAGSLRTTNLPMPPRINSDVANMPFLAPSYPRSASPSSPVTSIRSARSGSSNGSRPPVHRIPTSHSPLVRDRSRSPELASNLDCAFPSFPTSSSRPGTSNGSKTPSERAPSRGGLRAEPQAMEPRSPRTTGGQSVMKRANTLRGGPFDAGRRKTSREEKADVALDQVVTPRKDSLPKDGPPAFKNSFSNESLDSSSWTLPHLDRSNTFPLPDGPRSPAFGRAGSEPNVNRRPSATSLRSDMSRPSLPELSFPLPDVPRSSAFARAGSAPNVDRRPSAASMRSDMSRPSLPDLNLTPNEKEDTPPVPRPVQHHRQPSKHSASESASSSASQPYSNPNSSEGPSPISSVASSMTSSMDTFSPISQLEKEERPKSMGRLAGFSTKSQQQNPGLRAEQPAKRASPPPNFARPRPQVTSPVLDQSGFNSNDTLRDSNSSRESHQSTNNGSADFLQRADELPAALTIPIVGKYEPYRAVSPAGSQLQYNSNADSRSNMPPPPIPVTAPRPLQRRTTSAKAVCRGCNILIEGKSVKAADGRLTGRWHKHCFTCKTCSQPFATADFYVINNEPYCKQHYHEKNGSVCYGCKRGIEGQYLETSNGGPNGSQKHHPTCFTCCECRRILSNDYFEIRGQAYCERHAMAAMRGQAQPVGGYPRAGPGGLQPPGRRDMMAERRTTKLMMM